MLKAKILKQGEESKEEETSIIYQESQEITTNDYFNDPNVIQWVTSIYEYKAANEGELTFQEGEWIGILEDYGDGWARGTLNGVEGVLPMSYVQASDSQAQEGGTDESTSQVDDQKQQRRKEARDKLKGEMKDSKDEFTVLQQRRDEIEKEVKQLTETSQKLKKEVRYLKSNMSEDKTFLFDLIKLCYSMDVNLDATVDLQSPSAACVESLKQFASEYVKESKNSSSLAPFASKTVPKIKELADSIELFNSQALEAAKLGKDFRADLELMIKVVDAKTTSGQDPLIKK